MAQWSAQPTFVNVNPVAGPRGPLGSVLPRAGAPLGERCAGKRGRVPRINGRPRSVTVVVAHKRIGSRSRHVPAITRQLRLPVVGSVTGRRIRSCDIGATWATRCDRPRSCVSRVDSEGVGAAQLPMGAAGVGPGGEVELGGPPAQPGLAIPMASGAKTANTPSVRAIFIFPPMAPRGHRSAAIGSMAFISRRYEPFRDRG